MLDNIKIALDDSNHVEASVFVADGQDFDPQTLAMLQAFYSRSTKSIGDRVEGLNAEQVRESLHKFYIGYGHRSIGQCANFTIFLEDVSIFAAKMIQHHPLYNGQETSTRYYDFSTRPMLLPKRDDIYEAHMRDLYASILGEAQAAYLRQAREEGHEIDANMERTCKAKAFDLARCVLTAGHTTKLSWTTNFDQAAEQLAFLINSPVHELNVIGTQVAQMLYVKYPQAFADPSTLHDERQKEVLSTTLFDDTHGVLLPSHHYDAQHSQFGFNQGQTLDLNGTYVLKSRVRNERVPRNFAKYGSFDFTFNIDFGSWRDLHRHRNGNMYFPSYTGHEPLRMHQWYLDEMRRIGIADLDGVSGMTIEQSVKFTYDKVIPYVVEKVLGFPEGTYANTMPGHEQRAMLMYYVPMGTEVRAHMRYDLPQAVYIAELRSARTVHPTARIAANFMADVLRKEVPSLSLFTDDFDSAALSPKRGQQTILERP